MLQLWSKGNIQEAPSGSHPSVKTAEERKPQLRSRKDLFMSTPELATEADGIMKVGWAWSGVMSEFCRGLFISKHFQEPL